MTFISAVASIAQERESISATEGPIISTEKWTALVAQVQAGDQAGMEALYGIFSRGVRFQLCRQLGVQDLDDRVHDVFLVIVDAIQAGELRDPERLLGFIRTVVRRFVASHIDYRISRRKDQVDIECGVAVPDSNPTPEERAISGEKALLMRTVLEDLSQRDREVLVRFYLREQTQEQICAAMDLTDTQFRLLKSRAKQRFSDIGKRRVHLRRLTQYFVRKK